MKIRPAIVAFCLPFALALFLSQALANCGTRHFYNNSSATWTLAMGSGSCSIGNVNKASECVIPPWETADIHYVNADALDKVFQVIGGGYAPGRDQVTIKSNDGKIYPAHKFNVTIGDWNECYVHHDGNTGNVVLNEPADGDIQTCSFRDDPNCAGQHALCMNGCMFKTVKCVSDPQGNRAACLSQMKVCRQECPSAD